MKNKIHPTAIIEDGARIGDGVTIGPFSLIGSNVTLADDVVVDARVTVRARTTIGPRTRIAAQVIIGGDPQDLSYHGEDTAIEIGADCFIRENATVHRGTAHGRGTTTIGDNVFMMVGSHVAHDCIVGDHVILTNNALLGGHSQIGDYAILGGGSAVQQRIRVGAHCFIGGLTGVDRDVPPYAMANGQRPMITGINVRGLKRRGFTHADIMALRSAMRLFFAMQGSRPVRIDAVEDAYGSVAAVMVLIDFLRAAGNRPLALPRRRDKGSDDDIDA